MAEGMKMLPAAEAQLTEEEERHTRCGAGPCRPQSFANMKLFSLNLAAILLFHISLFSYGIGTVRTVEKRFGFSSQESGLINAVNDCLQIILVVLTGYFGRKTHKPKFISISILFTVVGAFLVATPFFIYGPKEYDPALIAAFKKSSTNDAHSFSANVSSINYTGDKPANTSITFARTSLQVCETKDGGHQRCSEISHKERSTNRSAFYILIMAQLLFGIGTSGIGTLGLAYIDENVKKEDSAIYVGVVTSMYALSPIIGFSLAAVTTRRAEDLSEPAIPFTHPQFVGCWWLGYVFLGILIFIAAIPMYFFPKHLPAYYTIYKKPKMAKNEHAEKTNKIQSDKPKSALGIVFSQFKGFPLAVWKLISNPAYITLSFSKVASMYFVVGVILNLPRYMEIHFGKPAYVANIVSAISGALGGATGNILGGVIMKKLHLKPRGSVKMYIGAIVVAMIGITIFILVKCPQVPFAGQHDPNTNIIDVTMPCNANCSCSRDKYQPMCSTKGVLYFSPCHAGCSDSNKNRTFTDCACLSKGESLTSGACTRPCQSGFYVYVTTFFLLSFFGSLARVPATILMFRIVDQDLKGLALGVTSFLFNLLVFVPGPIAYGMMFDSACLVWGQNCGSRGACYFYNITKYRLFMHGVTLSFQCLSLIFALFTWLFVHRLFSKGGRLYEGKKDGYLAALQSEGLVEYIGEVEQNTTKI